MIFLIFNIYFNCLPGKRRKIITIFHLLSWKEKKKIITGKRFKKIFTFRNLVSQEVTVPTWDGAESDVTDRL